VLAPGYYASQDVRTPVKIGIAVLVITQLLNVLLVPRMAHAGLALSIGLGALVNAAWLLIGLLRRGSFRPAPGWALFAAQVLAASLLLGALLSWLSVRFDWVAMGDAGGTRAALLAGCMVAAALVYFGALWLGGLRAGALLRR